METGEFLIYSDSIPSRLQYIADFFGNYLFGKPFLLSKNREDYEKFDGPKLNYSPAAFTGDKFWIKPHEILFEKGINPQETRCQVTNGLKCFFETSGHFPFDIFAAAFYLLSRYEEYLPHKKDKFGRYAHQDSLASRENFLDQPLVDQWAILFKEKLGQTFKGLNFRVRSFTFLPTYDIDEAWSYKSKSIFLTLAGTARAVLNGQWDRINERRKVLTGKIADPYDSFEWMDEVNRQFQLDPVYFFLLSSSTGKYDRNILPTQKALKELIRQHGKKYLVGIHPSWQSGDDPGLLKKEIQALEGIIGKHVDSSRQHFIRFTLPDTYRNLINAGIRDDYSMGYGSINGFRASITTPFFWYDLGTETATRLLLFPFCFMEANCYFEQNYSADQAFAELRKFNSMVKSVDGLLITIWHNTFLGTEKRFAGWRDVYKNFLSAI